MRWSPVFRPAIKFTNHIKGGYHGKKEEYSAEYKAKVALEAIEEEKTINEIASHYGMHP